MKKMFIILYAIIIIVLVASIVFYKGQSMQVQSNNNKPLSSNQELNNSLTIKAIQIQKFTQEQLATHNIQTDCWIAYKGEVYDLTDWLPRHPGSAKAIAPFCGRAKEFETAFTDKHGTDQVERLKQEGIYKGDLE